VIRTSASVNAVMPLLLAKCVYAELEAKLELKTESNEKSSTRDPEELPPPPEIQS